MEEIRSVPATRRELLLAAFFAPRREGDATRAQYMDIPFFVLQRGRSKRRYLHIHGDESTARDVLREHLTSHEGKALLVDNQERLVPMRGGKLDPNRMFSREGAAKNLQLLNPDWTEEQIRPVLDRLDRQRGRLLRALFPPGDGLLLALHNNSRGYSVNDELEISDDKALNDPSHPHEFFLVTDPEDFRTLAASPYNVVLQKNGPKDDDGSLSRLAARRNIRYANLECGLGKAEQQKEMLLWLEENVR